MLSSYLNDILSWTLKRSFYVENRNTPLVTKKYFLLKFVIHLIDTPLVANSSLIHELYATSRGWDVIWRDLFVQIELGVNIASLGIK